MKRTSSGIVWLVLSVGGLCVAAPAHAQSLADVARNEQARRKEIKHPTKVYTNDDVRDVKPISTMGQTSEAKAGDGAAGTRGATGEAATGSDGGTVTPPAGAAGTKPGTPGTVGGADEAQWRARMVAARDQIARANIQLGAMQTRTAQLAVAAATQGAGGPASQSMHDVQQETARLRADVQRYQQALTDLEEQASKAGVPAGWLR